MTLTIADARESLRAAVAVTGIDTYAYIQDSINAPCAHVVPMEYDPRMVLSGVKGTYPFQVRVYVNRAATESNQILLDTYRDVTGSASIVAAVQLSTNWTVALDYASVTRVGEVQAIDYGGAPYLVFELDVEVVF